ncbi:MAG: class I SAM-dependent methyltransferase [Acidimicrobiales bacterium]|nr:class I SAM-dependent methyltransferase [Acidimicrobiales bacterium]MDG2217477.1 class I SAM-dependent methyltransferase [Acidimicrobiales bacterium]
MGEGAGYNLNNLLIHARNGEHRWAVGGMWDEIGALTFAYLRDHGLTTSSSVLDIGCGALRVGVHLIDFLDPGGYFGVDPVLELMEAGYDVELADQGLQDALDRSHLSQTAVFDFGALPLKRPVDIAFAQSVFSHLPINDLRLCLTNLASVTVAGARMFATVFLAPDLPAWSTPITHPRGGVTTYPTRNPFHFHESDLVHCTRELPWNFESVVDWSHPRDQMMATFVRV